MADRRHKMDVDPVKHVGRCDIDMLLHLDEATIRRLRTLSDEESRTVEEIVALAVKRYENEAFWAKAKEGFERLRADPVAWKEYQDEIAHWG